MGYPSISTTGSAATAPGSELDLKNMPGRTTVSAGTHTIDIIDTAADDALEPLVGKKASDDDSIDTVARSESVIRTNRRGSGWTTLEVPVLEINPTLASTLETPAVRSARLSPIGTPDSAVQSRRSRYEAALTIAVSKESMHEYVRELNARRDSGTVTTPPLSEPQTVLDDVDLCLEIAPLPSLQQNRAAPLVGISAVLIVLLSVGWLVAREWPTDFTPSVKALVSDR